MTAGGGPSKAGSPLGDRYKVVRELGRDGFGQTYLAEDLHRYHELCVVKEFVPQVEDSETLEKAKELFEREASVLYQLGHKQIPEFRQLLQVQSETGGRLFIVQDYEEGPTYQKLLEGRQRFNGHFSETEITQMLYQLLPVLSYIHSMELVHRDISPENLILRRTDGLPVLIDFGSVKEIAAVVRSKLSIEGVESKPMRIGKVGFVPQEQLASGKADPSTDLYGLAATLMVLATGDDASMLYDPYDASWKGFDRLSPKLARILSKMLAAEPEQRYQSAEAVLADLNNEAASDQAESVAVPGNAMYPPVDKVQEAAPDSSYDIAAPIVAAGFEADAPVNTQVYAAQADFAQSQKELAVAEAAAASEVYEPSPPMEADPKSANRDSAIQALLGLLGLLGLVFLTLALLNWQRPRTATVGDDDSQRTALSSETITVEGGEFSLEEVQRKAQIRNRREALDISNNYFERLVDQLFYAEYPNLRTSGPNGSPKPLTNKPEDEPLRIRWDNIASNVLDIFDENFSQGAGLSALGNYSENDRGGWRSQVNAFNVGGPALFDLVDAKFFALFPDQTGTDFLNQPVGQIYYALAANRARSIETGSAVENIRFAEGTYSKDVSGQLMPGDGRIYTMQLTEGQLLRINLSAPAESTLFSLYLPVETEDTTAVFEDSEQTTWSGSVERSGYYQAVITNRSDERIRYQLTVSVDSVTTEPPVAPPREEETTTDNSEEIESSEDTTESTSDAADATTDEEETESAADETAAEPETTESE